MKMKFQPPEHEREPDEICMKNVPCPCVNPANTPRFPGQANRLTGH